LPVRKGKVKSEIPSDIISRLPRVADFDEESGQVRDLDYEPDAAVVVE
jgi:hypothetical protein